LNTVDVLSKIYDGDVIKRGSCGHPMQHVTLGLTKEDKETQHFGSYKLDPWEKKSSANFRK
jgi:hypothetical protein